MDVYLVWYDNGELYEDNYRCVEGVFSSLEKALEALGAKGMTKLNNKMFNMEYGCWMYKKETCSAGKTYPIECPEDPKECPFRHCSSEDDEDEFSQCDEEDKLFENYYDNSFYYIEKMELDGWGAKDEICLDSQDERK